MSLSPTRHVFHPRYLFQATPLLLRRGKPRPRAGMFPDKYRRVPTLLKPQQGGQQFFNDFLMRQANEEAMKRLLQGEAAPYASAMGGRAGGVGGMGTRDPLMKRQELSGDVLIEGMGMGEDGDAEEFRLEDAADEDTARLLAPRLPTMDFQNTLVDASEAAIEEEMRQLRARDGFLSPIPRSFNEREWYEVEKRRINEAYHQKKRKQQMRHDGAENTVSAGDATPSLLPSSDLSLPPSPSTLPIPAAEEKGEEETERSSQSSPSSVVPERILSDDYFHQRYGFSLLLRTRQPPSNSSMSLPPHLKGHPDAALERTHSGNGDGYLGRNSTGGMTAYSQLDLWAELPRYHRGMIFLYLISRRRNTYAVAYDYDGKRFLHPYTAGNRGLKGGDRGFRGDGSTDNGHQVTSAYLNDLIPKIRERRAELGLPPLQRGDKVDLVVRVMGFYNGRQGAVRAVQDRSAEFTVRYLEDITPFPLNGPKMPRGVFR